MQPIIISKNLAAIKKYISWRKKLWHNINQYVKDSSGENIKKNNNDTSQTMWIGISYCTKFESSLEHNAIFNCAMFYLVVLIMIGSDFIGDLKNNQINPWSKRNYMILNHMMMEVWAIEFGHQKSQQNRNIADKLTKFEAYRIVLDFTDIIYRW